MTLNTSCAKCGSATRLVGIEPHPRLTDIDVWTFECGQCGHTEIASHPLDPVGITPATEASGQTLN
jgi:hypothetical protein